MPDCWVTYLCHIVAASIGFGQRDFHRCLWFTLLVLVLKRCHAVQLRQLAECEKAAILPVLYLFHPPPNPGSDLQRIPNPYIFQQSLNQLLYMATSMSSLSWLQGWNNPGIHSQTSVSNWSFLGKIRKHFNLKELPICSSTPLRTIAKRNSALSLWWFFSMCKYVC